MAVYLFANLEIQAAEFARFIEVMGEIEPIVASAGWRLVGAFVQRTGRLNTVIDLWELEDFGHMDRGMRALAANARFPEIKAVLDAVVLKETLTLADKLTYPVAAGGGVASKTI